MLPSLPSVYNGGTNETNVVVELGGCPTKTAFRPHLGGKLGTKSETEGKVRPGFGAGRECN